MTNATTLDVFQELCRELGLPESSGARGRVVITGSDPVSPSPHRIGDAAAAALAVLGVELSELWQERGGDSQEVMVSVKEAVYQLMAFYATTVNGVSLSKLAEDPKLMGNNGFYRAADGRFIFMLFSYSSLRDITCDILNCPPSRNKIAEAVAQWDPFDLEESINARGGTAIAVRTQKEWREHPQGQLLLNTPLINIEKVSDSVPEPFPAIDTAREDSPLDSIRVLDNTHVIAGPMASRIAAEFGADVLHISAPAHPDPNMMIIETGIGKQNAFCDLLDPAQAARFWEVLGGADVYVSSYLGLEAKGFDVQALVNHRPGLVVLDYRAWGVEGPWSRRGGFDQLACSATGFSAEEGSFEDPKLPPTYLLNDYLAAILGAAGAIEALRRRARDGGSYRVHIDLARVCMWVQDLGLFSHEQFQGIPSPSVLDKTEDRVEINSPWGTVSYLPTRVSFSSLRPKFARPSSPLGASPLAWW